MRTALVPPRAFVLAAGVLLAASALSLSFWVITAHSHHEWILPGGSMANSRSHGGPQGSAPANDSAVATNTHACHQCRTAFNGDDGTGYPPVAFRGRMANLVSPSMFRDMADYVISWPWSHFGESVYRLPLRDLNRCLPAVPIVYWKADGSPKHVAAITRRVISFPKPFILITGQSDTPVPSRFPDVLSSPQLLRWFGQNNDMLPLHPKFTPIPIGLNCWEHCTAMERYLTARKPGVDATPKKTFLVNFSPNTDANRGKIRALLCNSELSTNTTCVNWGGVRKASDLSVVLALRNYEVISQHMYVVAPRGGGEDTHRAWEALYLGAVPIVKHSPIDSVFKDLPVHFVDEYNVSSLDVHMLRRLYRDVYHPMFAQSKVQTLLHRQHFHSMIRTAREEELRRLGIRDARIRNQCWGYKCVRDGTCQPNSFEQGVAPV